jgi:hypothetical protein
MMKQVLPPPLLLAAALCAALACCGKDDARPSNPQPPFYGTDYAGRYRSVRVFSNGNDASDHVQVNLHLRAYPTNEPGFVLEISERNPATGTQRLETWGGFWNTNPSFDSLFLQRQVQTAINYLDDGLEISPVYQYDTLLVQKVSPGIWSMRWRYNAADQNYHMERL